MDVQGIKREEMNKRAETSREKATKFAHGPDASIALISRGNKATQKKEECLQSSGSGAAIQEENAAAMGKMNGQRLFLQEGTG